MPDSLKHDTFSYSNRSWARQGSADVANPGRASATCNLSEAWQLQLRGHPPAPNPACFGWRKGMIESRLRGQRVVAVLVFHGIEVRSNHGTTDVTVLRYITAPLLPIYISCKSSPGRVRGHAVAGFDELRPDRSAVAEQGGV